MRDYGMEEGELITRCCSYHHPQIARNCNSRTHAYIISYKALQTFQSQHECIAFSLHHQQSSLPKDILSLDNSNKGE